MMNGDSLYAEAKKVYDAGNRRESIPLFEQARQAFLAENNRVQVASVNNDLGVLYYLTGKRDQAHQCLQDALAAFEALDDVPGQAKALGNLAQLQNKQGDRANAEQNYLRAAELFLQNGDKLMASDTFRALSQMQLQNGRWLESLNSYERALSAKGGSVLLRWFLLIPLKLVGLR